MIVYTALPQSMTDSSSTANQACAGEHGKAIKKVLGDLVVVVQNYDKNYFHIDGA